MGVLGLRGGSACDGNVGDVEGVSGFSVTEESGDALFSS